jgi:cytochrome c biogenesis protein CcmG, thiol:disulfide interchange protein DsbE
MTPRSVSIAAVALAVLVLLVVGLLQLGGSRSTQGAAPAPITVTQARALLSGSPPPLAALHAQANQLLPGGLGALRARLAALRGTPVVINKWASWCEPCRAEFPIFQRVSVSQGKHVAFIGVDSGDTSRSDALTFLHTLPVSYPSYYDRSGQAGVTITDSTFTPVTVFFDSRGKEYIHQGPYPSVAKLEADVRRYALDG